MISMWQMFLEVFQVGLFWLTQFYGGHLAAAIVSFSILARLALLPLTVRMTLRARAHARQLQALRPELGRVRERWKGDPQRLTTETLAWSSLTESTKRHVTLLHAELGAHGEAINAYRMSDARVPGRFNSILGVARSSAAIGDADSAGTYYQRLIDLSVEGSSRPGVLEAKSYLAAR